jgi:hypothetical protein
VIHHLTKLHSTGEGGKLRAKHLAIVRAALTFWDEEMASAPEAIYGHYLHSKDQGTRIAPTDVATARAYFNEVDLKFALIKRESDEFLTGKLADQSSDLSCPPGQQIVCILVR